MGQLIDVTATNLGDVALFDLDRSLTGQDGRSFDRSPPKVDDPASQLASRLFETDDEIETVHVLSNTVSVARSGGWQATAIKVASDVIGLLPIMWGAGTGSETMRRIADEESVSSLYVD